MIDELEPIHKVAEVDARSDAAFRLFAEEIGRWWPLATCSVAGEASTGCEITPGAGGGIFESTRDRGRHRWGTVMTWEPPRRLLFTWHPGRDPNDHTSVELEFTEVEAGRTRVRLIHSGWQAGDEERHRDHERGWDQVLGHYVAYVARAGGGPVGA